MAPDCRAGFGSQPGQFTSYGPFETGSQITSRHTGANGAGPDEGGNTRAAVASKAGSAAGTGREAGLGRGKHEAATGQVGVLHLFDTCFGSFVALEAVHIAAM